MRRLLSWRVRTQLIAVALVALSLTAAIEYRRHATQTLRSFHSAKARYYRVLAEQTAQSTAEYDRRAALKVPSAGPEFQHQMRTPDEWAQFSKGIKDASALFRVMKKDHDDLLEKYERWTYCFWEPLPPDLWKPEAEVEASH